MVTRGEGRMYVPTNYRFELRLVYVNSTDGTIRHLDYCQMLTLRFVNLPSRQGMGVITHAILTPARHSSILAPPKSSPASHVLSEDLVRKLTQTRDHGYPGLAAATYMSMTSDEYRLVSWMSSSFLQ